MEQKAPEKTLALKQFLIYLISTESKQISDIITEMRALSGVVTISIFEATRKMSDTKHLTKLKLKYLQHSNNLKENVKILKKQILAIKGVETAIIKIKRSDLLDGDVNSTSNNS